jgi:hypothetical protein
LGLKLVFLCIHRTGEKWETQKAMDLPFAHRCEILNRNGKNYLFAASVSKYKENPADWSKPGEMYLIRLEDDIKLPMKPEMIDNTLTRNHGMLRTHINGTETVCMSGVDGIFYFEQQPGINGLKRCCLIRKSANFVLSIWMEMVRKNWLQ